MKVFLFQNYLGRPEKPIYPLGLAYLCASLQDYDLQAFDPNVSSDPYVELSSKLERFKPDVVGISLRNLDTTQYRDPFVYLNSLQTTLDIIKKSTPKARLIIGGSGFSIFAQAVMERFSELDYGVMLEAEKSLPELLKNLDTPKAIPGTLYRENNEVKLSGPPKLPDFDDLPSPKWDIVDLDPYIGQLDTVGVQAKRGCGLKCAYCTYFFLNGSYYRLRSPEKIVAEIKELVQRFKTDHFIFVDSVFNIPRQHAVDVCEEMIRQKVKVSWTGWYNERQFDEDFFTLASEAGCRYFSFSPDAYSDESLRLLKKNLGVKDIQRVYGIAKRDGGASFGYNFFVNPPGQTYWDFIRLMSFWLRVRLSLRGRLYGFGLGNIRVEPETEILRIAVEEGVINKDANLMAETSAELQKLFYTNPKTPLINFALKIFGVLAKIKHRIRP